MKCVRGARVELRASRPRVQPRANPRAPTSLIEARRLDDVARLRVALAGSRTRPTACAASPLAPLTPTAPERSVHRKKQIQVRSCPARMMHGPT